MPVSLLSLLVLLGRQLIEHFADSLFRQSQSGQQLANLFATSFALKAEVEPGPQPVQLPFESVAPVPEVTPAPIAVAVLGQAVKAADQLHQLGLQPHHASARPEHAGVPHAEVCTGLRLARLAEDAGLGREAALLLAVTELASSSQAVVGRASRVMTVQPMAVPKMQLGTDPVRGAAVEGAKDENFVAPVTTDVQSLAMAGCANAESISASTMMRVMTWRPVR